MSTGPVKIPPPKRWDRPFDPDLSDEQIERILSAEPFNRIDTSRFVVPRTLHDLIKNDARLKTFKNGDIIFRQEEFDNNSVFFVLSGHVRMMIKQGLPRSLMGQRPTQRAKGFFSAIRQLWTNHKGTEVRLPERYVETPTGTRDSEEGFRAYLENVDEIIEKYKPVRLGAGEFFGVVSSLTRSPREATVFVEGEAELVEIRWQGIRDIRERADELRQNMDHIYRRTSLTKHLHETRFFEHLDAEALAEVADQTLFETYGDYTWHTSYKKSLNESLDDRLSHEPIISEENGYVDGLILIRAGFARTTVRVGHGHHTLRFLGHGDAYGFEEIAHNWNSDEKVGMQCSLSTIGYADILRVPTALIEKYVLPHFQEKGQLPALSRLQPDSRAAHAQPAVKPSSIDQDMLEFLVEERFINGTATMMIDVDRCTRCDDCVRACAATHDNNPRFIRHGPISGHHMVANACMHCTDPVCLIGCPTGAIQRDPRGGQVVINDLTCIGCAACANSCPYDNIRMVHIYDDRGTQIINQSTFSPILKATKCDLCVDQLESTSPACERACPHDALKRVNMRDLDSLAEWVSR
ncbi:MAG: 4Fe-4S dicluster domain-containing protein [Gammaproteobacteria bacterium]